MSRFAGKILITRDVEVLTVRVSIAVSEFQVEEVTVKESGFKSVARAIVEKSPEYEGCETIRVKFDHSTGFYSLSVKTGPHTRSVHRMYENQVSSAISRYMAEVGGV